MRRGKPSPVTTALAAVALAMCLGCGRHALTVPDDASATVDDGSDSDHESDVCDAGLSDNVDAGGAACPRTPTKLVGPFWLAMEPDGGATGFGPGSNVAVGAGALYLTVVSLDGPGSVWRVPLAGGSFSLVARTLGLEQGMLSTPVGIALADSSIARDGGVSGSVVLFPFNCSGEPLTLATTQGNVTGLAADAENVYVADATGTRSAPLASGASALLTARAGTLGLFAGNVVIADATASEILAVPVGGGVLTTLASGQSSATDPIACGDALCWMTTGPIMFESAVVSIIRLAAPAPPTTIVASADLYWPVHLAYGDAGFFVGVGVDILPAGHIEQVPATGGSATTVANMTAGFALNGDCLYWTDPQNGVFTMRVGD